MIYSSCFIISPDDKLKIANGKFANFSDDSILDLNSPNSPSHSSSLSGSSNSLANTSAPAFNHDDISVIGPASSSARERSNLRGRRLSSVSAKRDSRSVGRKTILWKALSFSIGIFIVCTLRRRLKNLVDTNFTIVNTSLTPSTG
ncbi:hypothetical protein OUZ56_005466 [Daphnia magna]|uniref:Uncharacterized protein n=1 Tax=Daphnia magna TaxID=35525 RepID=A0ABQ9YSW0_9CRUS|nr:hypothetical protein OUZ56_005466 [Daphnia magna]